MTLGDIEIIKDALEEAAATWTAEKFQRVLEVENPVYAELAYSIFQEMGAAMSQLPAESLFKIVLAYREGMK